MLHFELDITEPTIENGIPTVPTGTSLSLWDGAVWRGLVPFSYTQHNKE